ncbi:dihydrodipicolinate synthase family protein [Lichenifustis flavocetrariae]|uniref:Dihydrodipicolinate synthase family protein n=1 Tax=Lichenifustis flavocetrariae TaxID=2949735 RepID=A0AA42CM42_9HYPH|nr:dihydrodipicolinate synthase family protein [Lichenifustis flavocetrariae]MCW6512168.1 dihydrodipicolinate synthase family protein [Lichenifustis flavocetrariae]
MQSLDEAKGVYIISVTPFTDAGALDLQSTDRLVDFYLESGVTGITVLGMMGEAPKLTADESRTFTRHVLRRIGERVPVVVGVSSPGFAAMGALAESVMGDGAAGVMVAPPGTVRTDTQILDYFSGVAETLGAIPWVLQDFPLATGVQIAPSVIASLIHAIPTCLMLKHEDWPGLNKITTLRQSMAKGDVRRISILVGNGGVFLPEELARGADGAMTGFAYPEMMVEVCRLFAAGASERASDLFDAYLPLARYEQQPGAGLAVRKHVLAKRGIIASSALRKPGKALADLEIGEVGRLIERQVRRLAEIG